MRGSLASHLARKIGPLIRVKPARIARPGGVVSFSFDDFPKTALAAGAAILERYGLRGTYYTALGLAGQDSNVGPIAEIGEIRETRERGHELACHGYAHLDLSRAAAPAIVADLERNAEVFAEQFDGFAPAHFAYPFGRYLLAGKRLAGGRYRSCRGTKTGINHGTVDLADLRGTRIYAGQYDEAALRRLIDRNRDLGGWIVFYTHDVSDSPSPYGCTPRQFETIVAYAAERAAVLPVCDVLAGNA